MFNLANRRFLGNKSRLLDSINSVIKSILESKNAILDSNIIKDSTNIKLDSKITLDFANVKLDSKLALDSKNECVKKGKKDSKKLSFFDVFAGSGVVSEMILQNKAFDRIYINDFLHSNFVIYKAFFWQESFDFKKLDSIKNEYNAMYFNLLESSSLDKNVESNLSHTKNRIKDSKDFEDSKQTHFDNSLLPTHHPFKKNISPTHHPFCDRIQTPTFKNAKTPTRHPFKTTRHAFLDKNIESNYYEMHFGNKFFSKLDSRMIGFIRDDLDMRLESKSINKKEFYILLASLLYSVDRIANTVGHYDAFRKNVALKNRFNFELIKPLKSDKKIEIFREDSNILACEFAKSKDFINENLSKKNLANFQTKLINTKDSKNLSPIFDNTQTPTFKNIQTPTHRPFIESKIDIAFLDPPYNSRQYSRFYHFLETLTLNKKEQLFGVAKKPKPQNLSKYCTKEAKQTFKDLIQNLAKISKFIIVTYNNTESANTRSNAILKENDIKEILQTFGKISIFEVDFTPFNSGKTDKKTTFKEHKERIFVCQISH